MSQSSKPLTHLPVPENPPLRALKRTRLRFVVLAHERLVVIGEHARWSCERVAVAVDGASGVRTIVTRANPTAVQVFRAVVLIIGRVEGRRRVNEMNGNLEDEDVRV